MVRFMIGWLTIFFLGGMVNGVQAHVTPNIKLISTKDALIRLLPQGKLFLKDVSLSDEQMASLKNQGNWSSHENSYQFFVVRDNDNSLKGTAVFITEYTRHGPIVLAIGLDQDGSILGALITDVQTEAMEWIGPLLRTNFLDKFRGLKDNYTFTLNQNWKPGTSPITKSFALKIANAVKRSGQLFNIVFKNVVFENNRSLKH